MSWELRTQLSSQSRAEDSHIMLSERPAVWLGLRRGMHTWSFQRGVTWKRGSRISGMTWKEAPVQLINTLLTQIQGEKN